MPAETPWMSRLQVAAYLQVTVATLENWAVRGDGPPYVKLRGSVIRYYKPKLDEWLHSHTRIHTADDGLATQRLAKAKGREEGDRYVMP